MKRQHKYTLTVDSELGFDETKDLIEMLLASGREDAIATAEDTSMSEEARCDGSNAAELNITIA